MNGTHLDLDACLERAEAFQGHSCGGNVIGVRRALLGMAAVGIEDPEGRDRKNLLVFVEIDRCATDTRCGESGLDMRDLTVGGETLCGPCAGQPRHYEPTSREVHA